MLLAAAAVCFLVQQRSVQRSQRGQLGRLVSFLSHLAPVAPDQLGPPSVGHPGVQQWRRQHAQS